MAKYKTEGIVKDAKIEGGKLTFTITPTPSYLFEEKRDGATKKYILFVVEPEPSDTVKLTLTVAGRDLSVGKQKVGKNESIKVQGVTLINKSGTEILLEGASEAKRRAAMLFPETTKFVFDSGESAPMTLGAFFILMQNRSNIGIECNDPVKEPVVITGINPKN